MVTINEFNPTRLGSTDVYIWGTRFRMLPPCVATSGDEGIKIFMRMVNRIEDRIYEFLPRGSIERKICYAKKLQQKVNRIPCTWADNVIYVALLMGTIYTFILVSKITAKP